MKKLPFNIILTVALLFVFTFSFAGKRYWIGSGGSISWNSTANWSTTSGGAPGASYPQSNDTAYLSAGTGKCSFNINVSVKRLEVLSGYTDSILQNTYTLTIGQGGASFNSGIFQGGSASITSSGAITIAGGTFNCTSGVLTLGSHFTLSSGTFQHNNSTAILQGTLTLTGSATFNKLSISPGTYTIASGTIITVSDSLTTTGSSDVILNTGQIEAKGHITINNTSTSETAGGSGTIKINGTGNQTFSGATSDLAGRLCNILINKPSGTLTLKKKISVMEDWIYQSGTMDASTDTSTVVFTGNNADRYISGSHSLYNVTIYGVTGGTTTNTIPATDTLTILGTLKTMSAFATNIDSGVVSLKGNLTISATFTTAGTGGTATYYFSGTGNQTITGASVINRGRIGNVKINKTAGTLYIKNIFPVQGDWSYLQGTVDASTYSGTVQFTANRITLSTRNITGKLTLHHVTIGSDNASTYSFNALDTLTVLGDLTIVGTGTVSVPQNQTV
jgi:hypothetical protein